MRALALLVATFVLLGVPGPALASTGGAVDGETHPGVGLLLAYNQDGNRYRCTGTLVRPTVILTAAHCVDGVVGRTLVTFESTIAEQPPETSPFPDAADPSNGYTEEDLAGAGYVSGTGYPHPLFTDFADAKSPYDVGVLKLSAPVDRALARIADVGALDRIKQSSLSTTLFTAVGYGTEVRKPDSGQGRPTPMTYPLVRRFVDMPGQKVTSDLLRTNVNPNDKRGGGGTCFGDSGGPVFYEGAIAAVVSFGSNDSCTGISSHQRVDLASVQEWLTPFLDEPPVE